MQNSSPDAPKIRFPIRLKLMLAMVSLTLVFLACFSWVSIKGFESDKTASIYESILTNNTTLSALVSAEINTIREQIYIVLNGFSSKTQSFETLAKTAFSASSKLQSLLIFLPDESEQLKVIGRLNRETGAPSADEKALADLAKEALTREAALSLSREKGEWALAMRFFDPSTKKYGAVVVVAGQSQFLNSFLPSGRTASFLVDGEGRNLLSQTALLFGSVGPWLSKHPPKKQSSAIEVKKIENSGDSFLVSSAKLDVFGWAVVSAVPEKKATAALSRLIVTLGLILVFFICMTVTVSVLIAGGLTTNLSRLYQSVLAITRGDLNTKTNINSHDEIRALGTGIDRMTARIRQLLDETKEKVRMEHELKTAQIVQSTLFPTEPLALNGSEVRGFCLPASECSGDWWNYQRSGSKIIVAIGDATGHGAPAALVTSAARAAMAVLSEFDALNIGERMTHLNQAIYATTKGQIQMTLFMCSLDTDTGVLTYANASHDPPLYLPFTGQPLKRNQLEALTESNGYRLGEKSNSQYIETAIQMKAGDVIAFATDGITELMGESGEMFGERRFLKLLFEGFGTSRELTPVIEKLKVTLDQFRGTTLLNDDVTFCLLRYNTAPVTDRVSETATV